MIRDSQNCQELNKLLNVNKIKFDSQEWKIILNWIIISIDTKLIEIQMLCSFQTQLDVQVHYASVCFMLWG